MIIAIGIAARTFSLISLEVGQTSKAKFRVVKYISSSLKEKKGEKDCRICRSETAYKFYADPFRQRNGVGPSSERSASGERRIYSRTVADRGSVKLCRVHIRFFIHIQ